MSTQIQVTCDGAGGWCREQLPLVACYRDWRESVVAMARDEKWIFLPEHGDRAYCPKHWEDAIRELRARSPTNGEHHA